jgi:hypothetical protein
MIVAEMIRLLIQSLFAALNFSVIVFIYCARRNYSIFRTDFFGLFLTVSSIEFVYIVLVSREGRIEIRCYRPKGHMNSQEGCVSQRNLDLRLKIRRGFFV